MNQANILKVAAVAIAAPRYMGAFGVAIGVDVLASYPWLEWLEVYSGGAMAVLEGFALAYILSRWNKMTDTKQARSVQVFIWLIAATVPLVAMPYVLAMQEHVTVASLFAVKVLNMPVGRLLQVFWAFIITAVPMLIIMAVGYASVDEHAKKISKIAKRVEIKEAKEQVKESESAKPKRPSFACRHCQASFGSYQALNGHMAHCKGKQNGEQAEQEQSQKESLEASRNGHSR